MKTLLAVSLGVALALQVILGIGSLGFVGLQGTGLALAGDTVPGLERVIVRGLR